MNAPWTPADASIEEATGAARRISVGDIVRRGARRTPAKTALIMGERRLSYVRLNEDSNRLARGLLAHGLGRGRKVAMLGCNSIDFLVLYFAIAKAGAIACPVNPALPDADLMYVLEHADVSAVFADASALERLTRLLDGDARRVFALQGADGAGCPGLTTLAAGQSAEEPACRIEARDVAMIMYTSGTTSAPKGAMLSHLNVTVGALHNAFAGEVRDSTVATAILPLFHCGQLSISCGTLVAGGTVVIFERFDARALLAAIGRHRITWLFALPAMYRELLAEPTRSTSDLSSLAFCLYAMAPMGQETLSEAMAAFGKARFALTSGQTEAYPPTVVFAPEHQLAKNGAYWGRALPLVEVAVMADDGRLVSDGSVGEIVYRGPMLMEGYYRDEAATRQAFRGGWFHSGDLGRYDEDDLLLFVDRKKDIVKSGGENVSSVKVERCLLSHPEVAAAAVVGISDARWGEAVVAVVVTRGVATQAELIDFCRARLAAFEVPKQIVFQPELPQTATGKIQKFEIRKRLQDWLANGR